MYIKKSIIIIIQILLLSVGLYYIIEAIIMKPNVINILGGLILCVLNSIILIIKLFRI